MQLSYRNSFRLLFILKTVLNWAICYFAEHASDTSTNYTSFFKWLITRCKLRPELAAEVQRRRAVFAQNQSEAGFAELGEYSQNMLSEAFQTLNRASL